ncbi:MAG TPA: hypothetical protein VK939_11220 [Longimicrobiales bacterium]|nr:hypothetical protein [Longimicrobiales bacterium]
MSDDERAVAARTLLQDAGFADARVGIAGHDRSIAVIGNVRLDAVAEIASLAPRVKALGFRYVTLDLGGDG